MRNIAYKYRIYPDRDQQALLCRTFGCCRFVYNRMLSDKKAAYEKEGNRLRLPKAGKVKIRLHREAPGTGN